MNRHACLIAMALLLASCSSDGVAPADVPATSDIPAVDVQAGDTQTSDVQTDTGNDVAADATAGDAGDVAVTDAADVTATDAPIDAGVMDASGPPGLVVNEIRATGDDWVELYNAGTTAIDLGGFRIADTDTDSGVPRVSQAVQLPAGTMLAPGAYLFLLADQNDAGVGPQTACLDGGPSMCFHARWGISATRGETISIINALNVVVLQGVFPPNAVVTGQSYGRLPNGTGSFVANRPTPGAANAAP